MDEQAVRNGAEIRRRILGEPPVVHDAGDTIGSAFAATANAHFWAAIWGREGLDDRARYTLAISLLIARGPGAEGDLAGFMRGAVANQALTIDEVMELILHACVYAGYPAGSNAFRVAQRVFDGKDAP